MRRREFIRGAAAAAAGGLARRGAPQGPDDRGDLDRFGGWTGRRFEATGFFRLERDDRWWLVSPDGNAFLSFGINHLYPDLWNQDYNREAWKRRLGLERLEGPEFGSALRDWFLGLSAQLGFNTVGVHNSLAIVNSPRPAIPYMQPIRFVETPHWLSDVPDENFLDVFDPSFGSHCDRLAERIAGPARLDPFLLGYAMTDCPLFTEEDCRERPDVIGGARRESRIGWPRRLRNLDSAAPGKRAYVETMREIYRGEIQEFNATYDSDFDSFDTLEGASQWRPQTDLSNASETRDNTVFLQRTVAEYYSTARGAIRRYDPNHLFFGDKVNANTDSLDTVLPVTSRYTDLVFYQMYARYEVQQPGLDRWSLRVDKPFINGDSAFTMITDTMPRPYGPVADTVEQRAEWTEEFFRSAFARPDFVGWHYCGLIDGSNLVARKRARQHSGLLDGYGNHQPAIKAAIEACGSQMYEIAAGRA